MGAPPAIADTVLRVTQESRSRRQPVIVGDYILGPTLGVGATGKVKFALHRYTYEQVALKIIRKDLLQSKPAEAARFKREVAILKVLAGAAAQISSRQSSALPILSLLDVYETESQHILVLEYCPGGDLFDKISSTGYMSDLDALHAFQQLAVALHFAHVHGVSHRDLKLENVLIHANGTLKLADFGMASLVTPGSLLETSCGTPCYCAPEVLGGGLYNGPQSDCWSLGVILYAMVTGGLPFQDDNFARLRATISAGMFYIPDEVNPQVAHLLKRLLTVDPEERITLPQVIRSPWFNSYPLPSHLISFCTDLFVMPAQPTPVPHSPADHPSCVNALCTSMQNTYDLSDELTQLQIQSSSPPTPTTITQAPQALDPSSCHAPDVAAANAAVSEPSTKVTPEHPEILSAITDPDMSIVQHLTDLGLGEIPTILRRLRSDRLCIEKQFYSRILAYKALPNVPRLQALDTELPPSPTEETSLSAKALNPTTSLDSSAKSRDSLDEVRLPVSVANELNVFATSIADTVV